MHPINSVELYLPWNDTWRELPPLPNFTNTGVEYKMNFSPLMSLSLTDDEVSNDLLLLGGSNIDMSTEMETCTTKVWVLTFIMDNHTYLWSQTDSAPDMGRFNNHTLCHFN